jgi:hypothetical protein
VKENDAIMRYTKEQMQEIYIQWQQSGLSRKAFCKERAISHSTFQYWLKRFTSAGESSGFAELTLKPSEVVAFEVIFPSGARIAFQREPSVSWLRELVG